MAKLGSSAGAPRDCSPPPPPPHSPSAGTPLPPTGALRTFARRGRATARDWNGAIPFIVLQIRCIPFFSFVVSTVSPFFFFARLTRVQRMDKVSRVSMHIPLLCVADCSQSLLMVMFINRQTAPHHTRVTQCLPNAFTMYHPPPPQRDTFPWDTSYPQDCLGRAIRAALTSACHRTGRNCRLAAWRRRLKSRDFGCLTPAPLRHRLSPTKSWKRLGWHWTHGVWSSRGRLDPPCPSPVMPIGWSVPPPPPTLRKASKRRTRRYSREYRPAFSFSLNGALPRRSWTFVPRR